MADDAKSKDVADAKAPAKIEKVAKKKATNKTEKKVDADALRKTAAADLASALSSSEEWYKATGDAGARRVFNILKSASVSV